MSGTLEGGRKAALTNKEKYGADFYARIGSTGGKLGTTGGFYANRALARTAGAKGGRNSKRGYRYVNGHYIKVEQKGSSWIFKLAKSVTTKPKM